MIKNIFYTLVLLLTMSIQTEAQEQTIYLHYTLNPALINPGYAGFQNGWDLSANYRNRFTSFPGSPEAITVMAHGQLADRLGGGVQFFTESIGDFQSFKFGAMGSYAIVQSPKANIRGGLSIDYHSYSLGNDILNPDLVDITDPLLLRATDGTSFMDFGLGVYGLIDDAMSFGLSLPNVLYARLDDVSGVTEDDGEDILSSYFLFLGYRFDVAGQNFDVEPSIAFKKERNVPFHTDFNVRLNFLDNKLIGGLSYSVGAGDRFGVLIGTEVSDFRIAYGYDLSLNDFQDYSGGSHEVTLGVLLARGSRAR